MNNTISSLMLKIAEKILPNGYYLQGEPIFLRNCNTNGNMYISSYPDESIKFNASLHGNKYKPMRDTNRWLLLRIGLNMALKLRSGHFAELGTYQGVSAKIIFKHMAENSNLYCFDTFEGFAQSDIQIEQLKTGILVSRSDFSNTNIDIVEKYIRNGEINKNLKLIKGQFPETYYGLEDVRWRFVHLDCDLYEPMKIGLNLFWENMVKGAVMVVHDYNSDFTGVKAAVDEFCDKNDITIIPWIDQCGSVLIIK